MCWKKYENPNMQWLKLPAWKVGDRGFEPHYGLQVSYKKQNVSLVKIQ